MDHPLDSTKVMAADGGGRAHRIGSTKQAVYFLSEHDNNASSLILQKFVFVVYFCLLVSTTILL